MHDGDRNVMNSTRVAGVAVMVVVSAVVTPTN
jgi:hypothetical protein